MSRYLSQIFAKQDDPYLGVDLTVARKMAGLFSLIGSTFAVLLWPLSPPTAAIGASGWLVGGCLVLGGAATTLAIRVRPSLWGFKLLLAGAYLSVIGIVLVQWLAGGNGAPYDTLLLLPVLFVAAIYTRRMIAVFLVAVGFGLLVPLAYDGASGNAVASAISSFVLCVALASAVLRLYMGVRAQRLAAARSQEEAHEEARVDELTAIANRRAFEEALGDEISRANRMGTPLSMAMGDIENFKQVNDDFGHLEGDRCLNRVAQAMASELRAPDRVFRWGGDEFALLLPGADKDGADAVIDRLQAKVCAACRRPDSESIWIHFAAAELRPEMTAKELCGAADLALMAERAQDGARR